MHDMEVWGVEFWDMALSASQRRRLEEIAREASGIAGGCTRPDGRPMTFDKWEDECIEAGDRVQERARVAVGLSKVFTGDFNSRW